MTGGLMSLVSKTGKVQNKNDVWKATCLSFLISTRLKLNNLKERHLAIFSLTPTCGWSKCAYIYHHGADK